MDYVNRQLSQKLNLLSQHFPAIVLSGARQVGKTTFLKHAFPNADYVVFDSVIDIENARIDPDLFLDNHSTPLILDEIQYAPEVVSAIKRRIDKNRQPGQYYLTGSQQWGILKNLSESLAGRAIFLELDPFSLQELSQSPSSWLEQYLSNPFQFLAPQIATGKQKAKLFEQLYYGWYPAVQDLPLELVRDYYQSYLRTYIERDLRATAGIENYQQFGKFFLLASALSGQEVNQSQLGRDVGITSQTSRRWLDLLQSTYQWFEVPAYTRNSLKRLSNRTKGFVSDTGLMSLGLALSSPTAIASHPAAGRLYETSIFCEIRKQIRMLPFSVQMHHWRAHSGAEVDLVLEMDGKLFPIECKLTSHPTPKDARGILAFRQEFGDSVMPGLVLCQSESQFTIAEGVTAIPYFR